MNWSNAQPYLLWQFQRQLSRLGLPGVAGLGVLACCGMLLVSAVLPLRSEMHNLKLEAEALQTTQKPAFPGQMPAAQLAAFYRNFPNVAHIPDALEALNRNAAAQGVQLEQGEYRLLPAGADKLARYEMTLPVKGDYPRLRTFLAQMLADWPSLSLDSVSFQRQKAGDPLLEAQVKFTLLLLER